MSRVRENFQLAPKHRAYAVYDAFKSQLTDVVNKLLETSNMLAVTVPANCTNRLQPMDTSVNKAVKAFSDESFRCIVKAFSDKSFRCST